MTEYKVTHPFSMDFRRKKGGKDYSDTISLEVGQILELVDGYDLLFKIKGTKTGLRLDPWTIDKCLQEISIYKEE